MEFFSACVQAENEHLLDIDQLLTRYHGLW